MQRRPFRVRSAWEQHVVRHRVRASSALRVSIRWETVVLLIVATAAALWIAGWAWLTGNQPIRGDAQNYYDLALQIAQQGPLAFESQIRTYGYPFFLALLIKIVGLPWRRSARPGSSSSWRCSSSRPDRLAAARPGARDARADPLIYAATVVSLFILIHAVQMLTDVLSVVLVYLVAVLSVPIEPGAAADGRPRRQAVLLAMLALFLGGLAVIVRRPT